MANPRQTVANRPLICHLSVTHIRRFVVLILARMNRPSASLAFLPRVTLLFLGALPFFFPIPAPAELPAELLAKAGQGDVASQYAVARAYFKGEGIPQDYAKAAEWFRKAAEQGDAKAQRLVATMLVQ